MPTEDVIKKVNPRSTGELNDSVYVKHSDEINLSNEATELARCSSLSLRTANIRIAEYVSYDVDNNVLSTKRIHGRELFLLLWNSTSILGMIRGKSKLLNFDLFSSRVSELGEWLRKYHESTSYPDQGTETSAWLKDSFASKVNGVRKNSLMPEKRINAIEKRFLGEFEYLGSPQYLAENEVRFCRIHGDFIVYNMLMDDRERIHVIDFGDSRIGSNLEDVARFYSNLWAISQTSKWRQDRFLKVANRFLESYGLSAEIVETPFFKSLMAYNFLIHLYGQFCMRGSLSFMSNYELGLITKAGLNWINPQTGK